MKKIIKLNETDLQNIVNKVLQEQEKNEGILDNVKDTYQGFKGVWRGEGFDYYKYVSSLGNLTKKLKKLDEPNHKIIKELIDLKVKIKSSKMPLDKKNKLEYAIDTAQQYFTQYSKAIDSIEMAVYNKLK
jgi:hypothetical protein